MTITTRILFVVGAVALAGVLSVGGAHAAPGQALQLDVNGPASNGGKQRRCEDVARRHGFMLSPGAPVRVVLSLMPGYNRLNVVSARRGQIIDAPRPGWGMDQLCEDAMQVAERAYANEGQPANAAPPPPQYNAPAPQYAPPPPQYNAAPPPGGNQIALDVTGPSTNQGKVERCMRVAQARGFVVNPSAPVRVTLVLQPGFNRLQITTASRGEVITQAKPGWGMEQLCEDAMSFAAQVVAEEHQGGNRPQAGHAPPPPQARPQQTMALGPIPPSADLPLPAKAAADGAVGAWQAANFEGALAAFREADRLHSDPQFLFDMAVCEQRLGRNAQALQHTQAFMDRAPQSPYRPYAEQLFGELQAANGNP